MNTSGRDRVILSGAGKYLRLFYGKRAHAETCKYLRLADRRPRSDIMMFNQSAGIAHELSDLPTISFALCAQLKKVGISTPDELRSLGTEAAWLALLKASGSPSIQIILALEGAVQGIHWRALPAHRRLELIRFASSLLPEVAGV